MYFIALLEDWIRNYLGKLDLRETLIKQTVPLIGKLLVIIRGLLALVIHAGVDCEVNRHKLLIRIKIAKRAHLDLTAIFFLDVFQHLVLRWKHDYPVGIPQLEFAQREVGERDIYLKHLVIVAVFAR